MKAEVDPDQCTLSGYCVQIAPDLFRLGEERAEVLTETIEDPGSRAAAIEAESICPTAAIRLFGLETAPDGPTGPLKE